MTGFYGLTGLMNNWRKPWIDMSSLWDLRKAFLFFFYQYVVPLGLVFFFTFVNVLFLNAQNTLTTSEILASAKNQYLLELKKQRVDFLKQSTSKLPLMDELEFRTQTNDFQISEQRYDLRGRFHSRAEQRAQRNFQQANIELKSVEEKILMHELLRERYVVILEAQYFDKLWEAKKSEKVLLEDKLTVLQRSVNLPKFEIMDLIEAEDELQEAERAIIRLENANGTANRKIFRYTNEAGFLQKENLQMVDIQQVMELARTLPIEPSVAHASLVKKNLNATLAIREQAVRQAREENTIEFFQARIGGTDDNGFKQNFSLGMGIRIPFRNSELLNLNELEYKRIEEQAEFEELRWALKERMAQLLIEMENQYRLYELLQSQIENSQAENVFKQYQKIAGTSPLALLKLKRSQFKKELELFRVEQDIYLRYVELLDASGKMMEMPLRNYLMENQPAF